MSHAKQLILPYPNHDRVQLLNSAGVVIDEYIY